MESVWVFLVGIFMVLYWERFFLVLVIDDNGLGFTYGKQREIIEVEDSGHFSKCL